MSRSLDKKRRWESLDVPNVSGLEGKKIRATAEETAENLKDKNKQNKDITRENREDGRKDDMW